MKKGAPLGKRELNLVQFIASQDIAFAKDVAEQFGAQEGLARTTVLTMLERLRTKGYIERVEGQASTAYRSIHSKSDVMQGVFGDLVDKVLGGSPMPFVAYLVQSKSLSADDAAKIRALLDELEKNDDQ